MSECWSSKRCLYTLDENNLNKSAAMKKKDGWTVRGNT